MLFRVLYCLVAATGAMSVISQSDQRSTVVGAWRGESKCLVSGSACRDEDSLYRIAPVAHSQTKVTLTADKIVDGKEFNMGTSECSFSPDTHVLKCPLPNGSVIRFELKGGALNGAMTLADGTEWRKITLRRAPGTGRR